MLYVTNIKITSRQRHITTRTSLHKSYQMAWKTQRARANDAWVC